MMKQEHQKFAIGDLVHVKDALQKYQSDKLDGGLPCVFRVMEVAYFHHGLTAENADDLIVYWVQDISLSGLRKNWDQNRYQQRYLAPADDKVINVHITNHQNVIDNLMKTSSNVESQRGYDRLDISSIKHLHGNPENCT